MSSSQHVQQELFDVAELPGRPMLHWHGKQPLREILTDRQDAIFKRPPEAQTRLLQEDGSVTLVIEQFYSPLLLQKLSLEDDPEAIEDWRQIVASVLVDPAYDGEAFHPRITDTPARRDDLVRGEYTWETGQYGDGHVAVKIVDVLDEEWFGVVQNDHGEPACSRN